MGIFGKLGQVLVGCAVAAAVMPVAFAQTAGRGFTEAEGALNETPKPLESVGITEHLGEKIDLDLTFKNEQGAAVPLSSYFAAGKPVLLSLAYYNCENLCSLHLNGVKDVMRRMNWTAGNQFQYIVVSIDPSETPALAAAKKENYIKAYGRPEGANGWHFLTGDETSIKKLASQVGFAYHWEEETKQWAHASAAIVVTPSGEISRYLNGVFFDPQTVRLSLVEASHGQIASIVDRLILYCFHYDPKASKYTLYALNVVRAGSILIVLVLIGFLTPFWLRQRKETQSLQGEV